MKYRPRNISDDGIAAEGVHRSSGLGQYANVEHAVASELDNRLHELRPWPKLLKVQAQIEDGRIIGAAPCVVVGGAYRGKAHAPASANQEVAAHHLTRNAKQRAYNRGTESVLPAKPPKVQTARRLKRWLCEQPIEFARGLVSQLLKRRNHGECVVPPNDPSSATAAEKTLRLKPRRDAAVRCSAWLGVAPRPRLPNGCALELSDVLLIAADSGQTATKRKPPEMATRSALAALLGMKASGVMVGCASVPPNDPSSATRPTRAHDCNREAMAGFAAAHG